MLNVKYTESQTFRCLENLRETSLDLDLVHVGKEQCIPTHYCPGSKNEYIIHFVLSGKGTYSVNGRTWELSAGWMFLIYPNEPVAYQSDSEDPWCYAWIGVNGIHADTILKNCGFSRKLLVQPFSNTAFIQENIDAIMDTRNLTFANEMRRKSYLLNILAELVDNHANRKRKKNSEGNSSNANNTYLEQALEYIQLSYQDGIKVSDISEYVGISRTYLNHIFQKELGRSVQSFLLNYRMHKAANLLSSTDKAVSEIAKAVGYEDPLNFSKAFKKKFEISPQNYRKHKDNMDKFTEKQPWVRT